MKFRLDQLVPVKEAAQTLPRLLRRLEAGEGPLVLTKRGKPVAILKTLPPGTEKEEQ